VANESIGPRDDEWVEAEEAAADAFKTFFLSEVAESDETQGGAAREVSP
jgi:hypothetical protein